MNIAWLREQATIFGFDRLRITDTYLGEATERLHHWLAEGRHGHMDYMSRHALLRADPKLLLPGTVRVICVSLNYLPDDHDIDQEWRQLADPRAGVISIYARGRDYHKVLRSRLNDFAKAIESRIGPFGYRVFTDSAPLMEVERGKHTVLLNRESGSFFFLGEILVDLALPVDPEEVQHCGTCTACIDVCPTQAITAPYQLDARKCISYLTIENPASIPLEFRRPMGNRIYGCDDCQLICPWNKFAKRSSVPDFVERHGLGEQSLLALWTWTEAEFEQRHEGSAIRRIGYSRWRRNLAVAMGNALANSALSLNECAEIRFALTNALDGADDLVLEHIQWALQVEPTI